MKKAIFMENGTFTLQVKDVRSTLLSSIVVSASSDVRALKQRLVDIGAAPAAAVRLHIAHKGRMLEDAEPLEILRAAPVVVLAAVLPSATTTNGMAPPRRLVLPTREQVAAAWERFLPTTGGDGEAVPRPQADDDAAEALRAIARAAAAGAQRTAPTQPPPPANAAPAEDDIPEEERVCRICFCGEEAGRLLAPCRCRGSVRYVHAACLNEWRAASANPRSFYQCDQCGFRYRTERAPLAAWLQSERVVRAVTMTALLLLVVLGALLPFEPHRPLYRILRLHPHLEFGRWWRPWCDRLLVGLACPGALGVATSVRAAWAQHRGLPFEEQRWAGALLLSFAAAEGSPIILRPILFFGILHFGRVLERETRQQCRRLLTRCGERLLDANE